MASNSKFLAELLDSNGDVNTANLDNLSSTLGTASTNNTGDFLQVANNLSDLNNSASARSNLGLGQVATLDVAGGAQEFVATGAISAGQIVGLRSDGTIEVVADTIISETENLGASTIFENASTNNISATFDPSQNKIVIAYEDSANSYGTAVVGTVSGSSISFGTPVVFTYSSADYITALFDSSTNKVVIVFRVPSSSGAAIVGTVTGNSISFGSVAGFGNNTTSNVTATFDSTNDKVIVFYSYTQSYNEPRVRKGTVLANGISFSDEITLATGATAAISNISATFDSSQNKVILAYRAVGSNSYGTAMVVDVSGSSISYGTPVVFNSNATSYTSAIFDSSQNKVVIAYRDEGSNNDGTAVVGTVSGTSISFGNTTVFGNSITDKISATFDSSQNKVIIAYRDGNSGSGTAVVGTVSGTSISFGTPVVFESNSTYSISVTFSYRVIIAYRDAGSSDYGKALVYTLSGNYTTVNADSWIGIASQNISDGDSGPVTIFSGVNENQTGLNPNTIYYVNYDGTLTATENAGPLTGTYGKIGRAISSTKLLITE